MQERIDEIDEEVESRLRDIFSIYLSSLDDALSMSRDEIDGFRRGYDTDDVDPKYILERLEGLKEALRDFEEKQDSFLEDAREVTNLLEECRGLTDSVWGYDVDE